jgi:hypothetical protein
MGLVKQIAVITQKFIVLRRVVAKTEKAIARKKLSKSSKNKKCGKKSSRF